MLAPWPIGDKRTCRSDLCNNAFMRESPEGTPGADQLEEKLVAWEKRGLIDDVASLESPRTQN